MYSLEWYEGREREGDWRGVANKVTGTSRRCINPLFLMSPQMRGLERSWFKSKFAFLHLGFLRRWNWLHMSRDAFMLGFYFTLKNKFMRLAARWQRLSQHFLTCNTQRIIMSTLRRIISYYCSVMNICDVSVRQRISWDILQEIFFALLGDFKVGVTICSHYISDCMIFSFFQRLFQKCFSKIWYVGYHWKVCELYE